MSSIFSYSSINLTEGTDSSDEIIHPADSASELHATHMDSTEPYALEGSDLTFTDYTDGNMGGGFQDDHGEWHWRDADGTLRDGNTPPPDTGDDPFHGKGLHHCDISFGGYENADGTYHYESDNTDRDPQTGAIIRRY